MMSSQYCQIMKALFVVLAVLAVTVTIITTGGYSPKISLPQLAIVDSVRDCTEERQIQDLIEHYLEKNPRRSLQTQTSPEASGGNQTQIDSSEKQMLESNLLWLESLNASAEYIYNTRDTQLHRLHRVKEVCRTAPRFYKRFAGKTGFVSFGNISYGVIPKTGTTNLLRKICIMIGPSCIDKIGNVNEHYFMVYGNRKFSKQLSPDELIGYTASYDHLSTDKQKQQRQRFLFTVVRNPWRRSVSTFIEKFLFSNEYMVQCAVKAQWAAFEQMKVEIKTKWTFRDFIEKCIINQYDKGGIPGMNEHYRPQFADGAFCDLNYNFIAKLETFDQDGPAIIKQFNSTTDIAQLDKEAYKYRKTNEKSRLTGDSYSDYWRTIDPALMDRLTQIYSVDTAMFEYQTEPLNLKQAN